MCNFIRVDAKGQYRVSFLVTSHLIFKTRSLNEIGAH